eukprot:scpid37956/ scgid14248/ 
MEAGATSEHRRRRDQRRAEEKIYIGTFHSATVTPSQDLPPSEHARRIHVSTSINSWSDVLSVCPVDVGKLCWRGEFVAECVRDHRRPLPYIGSHPVLQHSACQVSLKTQVH